MAILFRQCHISGMLTPEQGRERLKIILDELGPGAFFSMDDRRLKHSFGSDKPAAIRAAKRFAKENHCCCRYDDSTEMCEFGRAYFKTSGNA